MMGTREKLVGGDEVDALTIAKRVYHWKPGQRKKVKRKFWKRIRQENKSYGR